MQLTLNENIWKYIRYSQLGAFQKWLKKIKKEPTPRISSETDGYITEGFIKGSDANWQAIFWAVGWLSLLQNQVFRNF